MLILPLLMAVWSMPVSQQPDSLVLADFSSAVAADGYAVNDGVMGGISSSTMEATADGAGVFAGRLSLENNGGFASVRTVVESDLSTFAGLVLRVRGDGRSYQVRLRTNDRFDGQRLFFSRFVTMSHDEFARRGMIIIHVSRSTSSIPPHAPCTVVCQSAPGATACSRRRRGRLRR